MTACHRVRREGLTDRQLEVLTYVAQGMTNRKIAAAMYMSEKNVEKHLANITDQLGVHGRAALVATALRQGLIP